MLTRLAPSILLLLAVPVWGATLCLPGVEQGIEAILPPIPLFTEYGNFSTVYDQNLRDVTPGRRISFSDGKIFEVHEVLGEGTSTRVFDIGDDKAVRVQLKAVGVPDNLSQNGYMSGYQKLRALDIPTIDVFPELSNPPEYVVVAKTPPGTLTWGDFVKRFESLPESERTAGVEAWKRFVKRTAHVRNLGDFDSSQLVLLRGEWALRDWDSEARTAMSPTDFGLTYWLPHLPDPELNRELTRIVRAERDAHPEKWKSSKYETTWLNPRFIGEERGKMVYAQRKKQYVPFKVTYFDSEIMEKHRLRFKGGKAYDADGNPFDTTHSKSAVNGEGRAIYVMDGEGNFYVLTEQILGQLHHSSLLSGLPVASAGEIEAIHGQVRYLSNESGHYTPGPDFLNQAIVELRGQNVDMSRVKTFTVGKP